MTDTHGIHHWRILWNSYRKLAWVRFEPTTTEFRSDALTDWAIKPWVQLTLRVNLVKLTQLHSLFSVKFYFSYCLRQSPRLFWPKFSWGNHMNVVQWLIHIVFTTGGFFEVAIESWTEWDLNPPPLNSVQTLATDTLRNRKVQSHLTEVFKLTKLILLLPVRNAKSERTFGLLKLIKNYFRWSMKHSWRDHLMALSAHKNHLAQLDLTKIASDFINKNDARKHVFVKFN